MKFLKFECKCRMCEHARQRDAGAMALVTFAVCVAAMAVLVLS